MIDPTKLVRSALLALALMFLAPLAGAGGSLLGVATAQAKTAPLVASVLFEGNIRFSDANLVAMIDTVNRGTADEAGLARDVTSITNAYKDVGFSAVQVSYRLEPVADSRVRVVFQVVEGTRAGIAAINFTGNNNVTAWQLKSVMRTKETGWLSWLLRDDNYTQEQLDMDRELIRQYYANHGFPDAQVTSAVAEYDSARQGYFISITVLEGNPIAFGAIGVETSIAGLDANRLTGSIRTREGTRFSAAELARSAQDMAVEATNLGYPFADVRPRVERDQAAGTFSVTYLVDEGQRLYVERVNITGNEKTRDFVIRRELPFAEGDPFNRALVTQGKMNIEGLGYFSRVNFGVEQGSASDKVVLNIMV
ncbi:MAG: outer membrane protein assembly factor BamA, partial [Devosia sp.]|nr:outer membrane protein assembly factor BamA [Devosia sp.]